MWPGQHCPTPVHYFVRLLHERGQLRRCYTQNIDSLESLAGLPADMQVAAHGNFERAHVIDGGPDVPLAELRAAVMAGGEALQQLRRKHGGLVKPSITFFGEALPERFGELVPDDFDVCDLLLVIGTSLKVHPFAALADMPNAGVPRLLINREQVGSFRFGSVADGATDVFLGGECDAGVRALAAHCGFDCELERLIAAGPPSVARA